MLPSLLVLPAPALLGLAASRVSAPPPFLAVLLVTGTFTDESDVNRAGRLLDRDLELVELGIFVFVLETYSPHTKKGTQILRDNCEKCVIRGDDIRNASYPRKMRVQ